MVDVVSFATALWTGTPPPPQKNTLPPTPEHPRMSPDCQRVKLVRGDARCPSIHARQAINQFISNPVNRSSYLFSAKLTSCDHYLG